MPLLPFIIASLGPAALLALGAIWGGLWAWAGLVTITVVVFMADRVPAARTPSDISGDFLSVAVALAHFALLVLGLIALAGPMPSVEKGALFVGLSLWFGQVSNSNAHELIHRPARPLRRLGVAVYASLLFGHHASAHPLVHHIHAATDQDPNSAPRGMGFWRYLMQAWTGSFIGGLRAENRRHTGLSHPYLGYGFGALCTVMVAGAIGGLKGVVFLLAMASYAQVQLFLSDYVQHYGLRRRILSTGKPEPIGPAHSWNAPHWASAAMMLNAPRHSDHHMKPGRAFPALELRDDMPTLPHSLPVMAVLALIPPLWRRVMDPRVARWTQP
ncbi:MAG: alkane 1-monooxygenase [Pseudomonadota bacterium]